VPAAPDGEPPPHRLVAIGDSLTHGFKSLAVFDTVNSYPVLIARALGIERDFRYATYDGFGGLPLNIEWLLRGLESRFGKITLGNVLRLFVTTRGLLERHEDFWERGPGSRIPPDLGMNHNLAVYGWDLRDSLSRQADACRAELAAHPAKDDLLGVLPDNMNQLAALRVLDSARGRDGRAMTQLEAAAAFGLDGDGPDGIETLIVFLGPNNALGTVLSLSVKWSGDDYAHPNLKNRYNVWRPSHFRSELAQVVAAVRRVRARHVLWLTVPHVTIAPLAKGVGAKLADAPAYFPYYVRPWAVDADVLKHPDKYPHLTGAQAMAIDSAIDAYNVDIVGAVGNARLDGLDWAVVDISGVLDRLAFRRYLDHPEARPDWWTRYPLPQALIDALKFTPDTRFLKSDEDGVRQGGLVALDGVHPTCSGYSLVARECIAAMQQLGVAFARPELDYDAVARADTLCTQPLRSLTDDLDALGWVDERFGLLARAERAMRVKP
jgi:hypothetical protein